VTRDGPGQAVLGQELPAGGEDARHLRRVKRLVAADDQAERAVAERQASAPLVR
jgi:hypothetical protein